MVESRYFFNRTFTVERFELADLRQSPDSEYFSLIKTDVLSKIQEFNSPINSQLYIRVHGKKKFHPSYKGELSLKGSLGSITVNFNPRLILHFVRLLQTNKTRYQFKEKAQQEEAIFGYTHNFLSSNFFQEVESSIGNSKSIEDKSKFIKFQDYEKIQKVLVMLNVEFSIQKARINLIHRTTKCCSSTVIADNLNIKIRNGNSFLFFELCLTDARVYDLSNYPNTINNFERESEIVPYALVSATKPGA